MILALSPLEIIVLRAGLQEIRGQSKRQLMNPDLHLIEAATHSQIHETSTDLLTRLEEEETVSLSHLMQHYKQSY